MHADKKQPYSLYKAPSMATLTAYVCVVVLIFLGAFMLRMNSSLATLEEKVDELSRTKSTTDLFSAQADLDVTGTEDQLPVDEEMALSALADESATQRVKRNEVDLVDGLAVEEILRKQKELGSTPVAAVVETDPEPVAVETPAPQKTIASAKPLDLSEPVEPVKTVEPVKVEQTQPEVAAVDVVETPVASTAPTTLPPAPEKIEGRVSGEVLAVNPDQRIVMISRGASDGLEQGNRFTVWRGEEYVGEIRISRVYATMSACDIMTWTAKGMRMTDIVRSVETQASAAPMERKQLLGG